MAKTNSNPPIRAALTRVIPSDSPEASDINAEQLDWQATDFSLGIILGEPIKGHITISPYEILSSQAAEPSAPVEGTQLQVTGRAGADAYHVREQGLRGHSYRTVQRVELATRLQLVPDYDPEQLVGRVFLLPRGV